MSKNFTEREQMILDQVAHVIEEFFYEERKHVPQNKYVFEVKADDMYTDYDQNSVQFADDGIIVPAELVGIWIMDHARDLQYDDLKVCINMDGWLRCVKKAVVSYVWEEIEWKH